MSRVANLPVEEVCLVDEENRPTGRCRKSDVHGYVTPLHRAFSIFLFDEQDRLLVQQRAFDKPTWPGIWSNSCCGHPAPDEDTKHAALRRIDQELHLTGGDLFEAIPDFRYRSRYLGIEENEICPVFIGRITHAGEFNRKEIANLQWISWTEFLRLTDAPATRQWGTLSPWSRWEARLLGNLGRERWSQLLQLNPFSPCF